MAGRRERGTGTVFPWYVDCLLAIPHPASLFPADRMHGYSDRINHAFAFAAKYYGAVAPAGSGMDYMAHPANVAVILSRYGCDQITIVGGILHHVLEEAIPDKRPVLERKISDKFGPVALAIAKDALEPKFDRRGGERAWQARKQEYLSSARDRRAPGSGHLRR